jgi:diacylglycerol kinase (ATP)
MNFLRKHHVSFKHALDGIYYAITSQPNFRVHITLSLTAVLLGIVLKISRVEAAVIAMTIMFGLGVEMLNTAVESMTDLITSQWHQKAKTAKDVSAGMMLLTAVGAVIVAAFIFLPRIWILINF